MDFTAKIGVTRNHINASTYCRTTRITIGWLHAGDAYEWCVEQFGNPGAVGVTSTWAFAKGYVNGVDTMRQFFFINDEDATLFALRWLNHV